MKGRPDMSTLSSSISYVVLPLKSMVAPAAKSDDIMPVPAPFCITMVSEVGGCPVTAVMMPPPMTPPEFIMD